MRRKSLPLTIIAVLLLATPKFTPAAEPAKDDRVVKDGMLISLEYTLKGADGKVIESSKGREPLKYIHGQRMMIPGLEKELTGMKVGGEKHVTVKPEDAYGAVNAKAFEEVPKEKLPPEGLKVGAILAAKSPTGQVVPMRVHQIKEKSVVMDMNHPMAGKTLVFDVKIVDIQNPPPPPTKSAAPAQPAKPAEPAKPAAPAKK
ncbi:MAG: Peptidyl-prolyl cis-trans isomerase (modular protein) [Deltaproteobacteria bacterium]|nr:Peptidyl-prolyl cis-trans isomerase (modular protein) [Deltaproteobacteria bacterium]